MRTLLLVMLSQLLMILMCFLPSSVLAADEHASHAEQSHAGHSDALMVLLGHKIALQNLQGQTPTASTLAEQVEHIKQAMPVLQSYMNTPKSYYLTTEMYHDSLENRAAMLADFSILLMEYQKQLVSLP